MTEAQGAIIIFELGFISWILVGMFFNVGGRR